MKLPKWNCLRCGHTWIPRRDARPIVCPKCKSPYYDMTKRESTQIDVPEKGRRG